MPVKCIFVINMVKIHFYSIYNVYFDPKRNRYSQRFLTLILISIFIDFVVYAGKLNICLQNIIKLLKLFYNTQYNIVFIFG